MECSQREESSESICRKSGVISVISRRHFELQTDLIGFLSAGPLHVDFHNFLAGGTWKLLKTDSKFTAHSLQSEL